MYPYDFRDAEERAWDDVVDQHNLMDCDPDECPLCKEEAIEREIWERKESK